MANYCYNEVRLKGPSLDVLAAIACFAQIAENPAGNPAFIDPEKGLFIDLSIEKDDRICYRSRWNPNIGAMAETAEHFNLDYTHYYLEPMMGLCGEVSRQNGQSAHIRLIPADFGLINYDIPAQQYEYRDQVADIEYDLWPALIQEKKNRLADPGVQRRLAGELPHIDLGGTDFIIDWNNRELIEAANPANFIDFRNIAYDQEWEAQYFLYDRDSHSNSYKGPQGQLPESFCFMLIPDKISLDPVAAALAERLHPADFLLSYPYQEKHIARIEEIGPSREPDPPSRNRGR